MDETTKEINMLQIQNILQNCLDGKVTAESFYEWLKKAKCSCASDRAFSVESVTVDAFLSHTLFKDCFCVLEDRDNHDLFMKMISGALEKAQGKKGWGHFFTLRLPAGNDPDVHRCYDYWMRIKDKSKPVPTNIPSEEYHRASLCSLKERITFPSTLYDYLKNEIIVLLESWESSGHFCINTRLISEGENEICSDRLNRLFDAYYGKGACFVTVYGIHGDVKLNISL